MGQLVGCIRGIGEACRALDFPVVSGNVSLYNETNGRAILPTPTIGGVGLIDDFTTSMTLAFKARGRGDPAGRRNRGWLGQSLYLREICGREEGAPPPVDLAAERRHGDFVRALIRDGLADRGARCLRRRPSGGARRNGDGVRHRRRAGGAAGRRRATPSGSARIRAAMSSPRRMPTPLCSGRAPPRCRWCGSARPAATSLPSPANGRSRSTTSARVSRLGCPPIWRLRPEPKRRIDARAQPPHCGRDAAQAWARGGRRRNR